MMFCISSIHLIGFSFRHNFLLPNSQFVVKNLKKLVPSLIHVTSLDSKLCQYDKHHQVHFMFRVKLKHYRVQEQVMFVSMILVPVQLK